MAANIVTRLSNLIRGFLSLFVSGLEEANPEIVYQNSIDSMTEKYAKLKAAAAAVIAQRDDIQGRLEKTKANLAETQASLDQAVSTNQDDLAVELIQQKNALTADLAGLTTEAQQASAEAEKIKGNLLEVKGSVERLKAEKTTNLARMQSAQARLKIQEQIEGLSVDADVQALDGVRTHIKTIVSQANLGDELKASDLDTRMKALRTGASKASATAELERLKAARAGGATPTKQM
ncbi:MAG TPA: PspA/IM30 family protein [Burkholderiaceae bacterium]|jgi:phage shock protein A